MSENDPSKQQTTHFGYEQVNVEEKAGKVAGVFHSVAHKYNIMNDVMSFGMHRLWKKQTIMQSGVKAGDKVLDIAGGTGDLTIQFAKKVGVDGKVILADINSSMLQEGRQCLIDKGVCGNVEYVQADAQSLPFPDDYFNCITIAFGLRNVTDKDAAIASMFRVLKPGGKLLILEFSKPTSEVLSKVYDKYSFAVIPKFGKLVANDSESYQYLVESIRMHPDQETLKSMMEQVGFERCGYQNLTGGIVALHYGYKI